MGAATAVLLCKAKAGICAICFFQPWGSEHPFGSTATVLSWRRWSWPCSERSWWIGSVGKAPDPAASDGPWPPTEHLGMEGSLLALEVRGAGSMLPQCQFATKFPWELREKIKEFILL